jgi:hypothetical protein
VRGIRKREQEIQIRAEENASETTKRMMQVAAVKAQVEAIARRLRTTVDELEEAVREMPDDMNGEEDNDDDPSVGSD